MQSDAQRRPRRAFKASPLDTCTSPRVPMQTPTCAPSCRLGSCMPAPCGWAMRHTFTCLCRSSKCSRRAHMRTRVQSRRGRACRRGARQGAAVPVAAEVAAAQVCCRLPASSIPVALQERARSCRRAHVCTCLTATLRRAAPPPPPPPPPPLLPAGHHARGCLHRGLRVWHRALHRL